MIKAVCFDLDGVYFTRHGMEIFVERLVERAGKNYELSIKDAFGLEVELRMKIVEKVHHAIFRSDEIKSFKRGEMKEQEYWNFVNEYLNLQLSVEEYTSLLVESYQINKDVDSYVKKLRSSGIKTCICSNNFKTRIESLENKFHFLQNFDVTIFSFQVGVLKPNKEIFEKLLESAQVKPEELIYSDDNEDKLQGALELGINAFVYETFEQFKNKIHELTN